MPREFVGRLYRPFMSLRASGRVTRVGLGCDRSGAQKAAAVGAALVDLVEGLQRCRPHAVAKCFAFLDKYEDASAMMQGLWVVECTLDQYFPSEPPPDPLLTPHGILCPSCTVVQHTLKMALVFFTISRVLRLTGV
eukprot:1186027-Prorocentrum_minimum.AAC.1